MNPWPPIHACFVTGTDTEVGKTCISAALVHWFARQSWRSAGFKPVAAGTEWQEGVKVNDDVHRLQAASSLRLEPAEVCTYVFDTACAPHVAARLEGRTMDRQRILAGAQALAQRTKAMVIEGVGGFCVPLGPNWDSADMAQDFGLPVILVVGLRLGCINHALLTAQAVRSRGLRLLGWVSNAVDPNMPWRDDTIAYLRTHFADQYQAPCLGCVPWLSSTDPQTVVSHLDTHALHTIFPVTHEDNP